MKLERLKNNVLGNPIRLGVMIYLLPRGKAFFKELVNVLEVTPGNLDSHLRTLEKSGYVKTKKVIADRPRTFVEITDIGIEETKKYLEILRRILDNL